MVPRLALALALVLVLTLVQVPTAALAGNCAESLRIVSGIRFTHACAGVADLLLEPAIAADDVAAIRAQVIDDTDAVQAEFALSFDARPTLFVFAASSGYAAGLHAIFGYPAATARWVADNSVSFFEPSLRLIAVNWAAIRERRPIAAIRHELTHLLTLRACAPRCDLVPAWLNEGQARLAEATTPGSAWRLLRVRYEAASLAATHTLLPLTALVTQQGWNAITSWEGYYKYQEAARAVQLLRDDVGEAAIPRLYARIRAGDDVARAYAALAGRSFGAFVDDLAARMLDGADAPGIATASGTPEGAGTSYVLYGFAPDSDIDISIAGRYVFASQTVRASPQGSWFGWLDDSLPAGPYRITAASTATCVTITAAKRGGRPALRDPDARGSPVGCAAPPRASRGPF